jgi:hypothetical protein
MRTNFTVCEKTIKFYFWKATYNFNVVLINIFIVVLMKNFFFYQIDVFVSTVRLLGVQVSCWNNGRSETMVWLVRLNAKVIHRKIMSNCKDRHSKWSYYFGMNYRIDDDDEILKIYILRSHYTITETIYFFYCCLLVIGSVIRILYFVWKSK